MSKPKWERIDDILTDKGMAELKAGQVLGFDYEGSRIYLKIMRKSGGKCWAKPIEMHNPEDVEVVNA